MTKLNLFCTSGILNGFHYCFVDQRQRLTTNVTKDVKNHKMRLQVIQLIGMLLLQCQIETVVLLLLIHYLFLVPLCCGFNVLIFIFFSNLKPRVKFDNRASSEFTCYLGVRQGEGVATILFSMY